LIRTAWSQVTKFIAVYALLACYFNLLPLLVQMSDMVRFLHMLLFFPLAYAVAKIAYKKGFEQYGVVFFSGWKKNFVLGYAIGFALWAVLFAFYFASGKYAFGGIQLDRNAAMTLAAVAFGFGFGSFISDMIVRGLTFTHFSGFLRPAYVFLISLLLYAADDMWYEGFDVQNTLFSLALGLGLTYVYFKTNSVWASAGVHFGLNTVYGLFFGVSGNSADGIFAFSVNGGAPWWTGWLSTLISLALFLAAVGVSGWFTRFDRPPSDGVKRIGSKNDLTPTHKVKI
jgi:membrane protease YdiL (CAAX protease family)